jgi:hypothetical protein
MMLRHEFIDAYERTLVGILFFSWGAVLKIVSPGHEGTIAPFPSTLLGTPRTMFNPRQISAKFTL